MENKGRVAYTKDEFAYINLPRKGSCGDNCASCKVACAANVHLIKVYNSQNVKKGDEVELELGTGDFLKMSFLLYIVPLIVMVASIIGLETYTKNTVLSISIGLILTAVSFPLIHLYVRKKNKTGELIVRLAEKKPEVPDESELHEEIH